MSTALLEQQYELGEFGLVFGGIKTTPYYVASVEWGIPELRNNDGTNSMADGTQFGRDYLAGPLTTFNLNLTTRGSALPKVSEFVGAWLGDEVRFTPGAVMPLRYRLDGRTRRIYGRPRECVPTSGGAKRGWVPLTATFRRSDHLFYEDIENQHPVDYVATTSGGITVPRTVPATFTGATSPVDTIINIGGDRPTWLCVDVYGPITNPTVDVLGSYEITLLTTLKSDQIVTIDPRPWNRGIFDNFGANLGGKLSWASPTLPEMKVATGDHDITLRGTDPTGTSSMSLRWRAAHAGY